MRSQNYGDKQREAQRLKKEEELWKKRNPQPAPVSEKPAKPEKDKTKNDSTGRGSA